MSKKIIIFLLVLTLFTINVSAATIYFDVQEHWARENIYWATNEVNIFRGYEDYTFKPEKEITRAEFMTILYRAAKNQGIFYDEFSGELEYEDFNINHWAYSYVLSLSNNLYMLENTRIKDIYNSEEFNPNAPITREEAARISSIIATIPIEEKNLNFTDLKQNYKYLPDIKKLYNDGIIIGYNDKTFRPQENITRAQASILIENIFEDMYYHKDIFAKEIKYINKYGEFFPLFENYDYKDITEEDEAYIKAVSTLEYFNFGGYIYPGDEHLYDKTPIQTLTNLHNNEYENKIGTTYYILRYGNLEKNSKIEFTENLLELLYENEKQSRNNKFLILKEIFNYQINPVSYNIVINSLIEKDQDIEDKFDLYFLKIEYLTKNNRVDLLEDKVLINFENIIKYIQAQNADLEETTKNKINDLKKDKIFNIILYHDLNKAFLSYNQGKYREGYNSLYNTFEFLKDEGEYTYFLSEKEKLIIGTLKKFKSMF